MFVCNESIRYVAVIPAQCDIAMWIRVDEQLLNMNCDYFLATLYVLSASSRFAREDKFYNFITDMLHFRTMRTISYIIWRLQPRTGQLSDIFVINPSVANKTGLKES